MTSPTSRSSDFLERWERARYACDTNAHARHSSTTHRARYPRATIIVVAHGGIVGDYLGGHEDWPHCGVTEFAA